MQVREITADDMQAIFDVRVATWHNPRGLEELTQLGVTHDSVRRMIQESHRGWLAQFEQRVVGFAMGDKRTGEMWVIAVLKPFEGQGIGKALLSKVEAWLSREGWSEIWLTTDTDENYRAVGLYRRLGWEDWKIEQGDRYMRKRMEPEAR